MKKVFVLLPVVFLSLFLTGCVNNLAIQELNAKAQYYLDKGDTKTAISRLESSLDLDENVFATRYNLGVAYIEVKEYEKAEEQLLKASELKPDFAEVYYSLGVAQENLAFGVIDKEEEVSLGENEPTNADEAVKLTDEEKLFVSDRFERAIKSYEKYLSLAKNTNDKDQVERQIQNLKNSYQKYGIKETVRE